MKVFRFAAALASTLVLAVSGATSAEATDHTTLVSGFEMYATSTQGDFAGSASGQGTNGLSGVWSIVVYHTLLDADRCGDQPYPCAQITGGSFTLAVSSPAAEFVTGTFAYQPPHTPGIVQVGPHSSCGTQLFHITDSLRSVGAGSQHAGTGSFDAYLWHYRTWILGRCVTYSATVKGTVVLSF